MNAATAQETDQKKTAILVYERNGVAVHCCCTPEHATQACKDAEANYSGASMFTTDAGWDAETLLAVSPDFRERVEEAKLRLQNDIWLRDALDKNDVPRDRALRCAIKKAFTDYNVASVRRALAR